LSQNDIMEEMYLDEQSHVNSPTGLHLNDEAVSYFASIIKWSKFFAIIGLILSAIMVLGSIVLLAAGSALLSSLDSSMGMISTAILMPIYMVMGFLYLYPSWQLYKFATLGRRSLDSEDSENLAISLKHLKRVYAFFGYITAFFLILYGIIFVGAIIGSIMS